MPGNTIKNVEDLIQQSTDRTKKVIKTTVKPLAAPGEHYLGIVLKVDAVLRNEKEEEEEHFSAVAKCLNFKVVEVMKRIVPRYYKKENGFYTEIIPTLEEFQKEIGLEEKGISGIFPKFYTSRSSLDKDSEEPDEDSVLFLENLEESGYRNTDRTLGFDLDGARLILKDLAAFHGIPLALKLLQPHVFEDKIQKHLYKLFGASTLVPPPEPPPDRVKVEDVWLNMLGGCEELQPYMERFKEKLNATRKQYEENVTRVAKEPFATICHSDLWTNNTMQVFKEGIPVKNKFIDFQSYCYSSPAEDVMLFVWSSVQLSTVQEHFDDLMKFYHSNFINLLDKCGCDTTPFSYDNFLEEIVDSARRIFLQIMFMQLTVFGKKGEAVLEMRDQPNLNVDHISDETKKRAAYIVEYFGRRGWL